MPLRFLTDNYAVSPQIDPDEISSFKEAGITTVICNRPDDENPPALRQDALKAHIEAAGLTFVALPFNQMTLTPDLITDHRDALDSASGKVLAYCASGTRSAVIWALGQAEIGAMTRDALIAAAAAGGYDLRGLQPTLDDLIARA